MPLLRDALDRGQRVRLAATGASMRPFIRHGDVVELEPCASPRLGDVVLAESAPGSYVLHRVVRRKSGQLFLGGDALTSVEGPLVDGKVLARVTTVRHARRRWRADRGVWRIAGILWLATRPVGPKLLQALCAARGALGAHVGFRAGRRAQSVAAGSQGSRRSQ